MLFCLGLCVAFESVRPKIISSGSPKKGVPFMSCSLPRIFLGVTIGRRFKSGQRLHDSHILCILNKYTSIWDFLFTKIFQKFFFPDFGVNCGVNFRLYISQNTFCTLSEMLSGCSIVVYYAFFALSLPMRVQADIF